MRFIKVGEKYFTALELERAFYSGEDAVVEKLGVLQILDTSLLVEAVQGGVDLNRLAAVVLAQRGMDRDGQWVGFAGAKKMHGLKVKE